MVDEKYVRKEELDFPNELIKDPYSFICNTYETKYPFLGKRMFSIISLSPISLIIPEVEISDIKKTNRTLSVLWLSPPGSGKTTLSEKFSKITINPISSHKITPARLIYEIRRVEDKMASLIISDISISFSNEIFIKAVERVVEEGFVDWDTMRNKDEPIGNKKIRAIACLSGTPSIISDNRIRDGILGRVFPLVLYLTQKQHKNIIKKINDGDGENIDESIENIEKFYKKIYETQKQNPINGFIIPKRIKKEIGHFIEENVYLNAIFKKWGIPSIRQLEDAYIILASHCFLNLFNRQIEKDKLIVNEEDLEVTKNLVNKGAYYSYPIYEAIERIDWYKIKTERALRDYLTKTKSKIRTPTRFVMEGLVKK
jgi:hypothetical protein